MKALGSIYFRTDVNTSLQLQLYSQMKQMIQRRELSAGDRLPSSRDLALQLRVSRNTVVFALELLISEGYLESASRSGVYVGRAAQAFQSLTLPIGTNSITVGNRDRSKSLGFHPPAPFRPAMPDVRLFPIQIWNRHRTRVLRREPHILHYQSVFSSGLDSLRQSVAVYLRENRGVRCDWREVAITSGSQQGLFLVALLLIKRGDYVYMEDPGYLGARQAWKEAGAKILPVPIDQEGIRLPRDASRRNVSLIYVTPSRQSPLGTCMSLSRRLSLLQTAAKMQTWIIEDDYDSEFRYSSPPLPSLQNLDENRRVIYVGSFSKILFPSLRLGYVVLPPSLIDGFARIKHVSDDHGPLIDQATLTEFMESGAFYTHLRRCRRLYAERQQCFLDEMDKRKLPLHFPITDGGMSLAGLLTDETDDRRLSNRLLKYGLDIPPLSRYSISNVHSGLFFGFTAFEPKEIKEGIEKVTQIMRRRH